jgi:serine/threonine protein kinase
MFHVGQLIGDKYKILRVIGEGGMGSVYAAQHLKLDTEVAIKVLKSEASNDAEFKSRFLREAQLTSRFKSPHIIRIYDCESLPSGDIILVMELLTGRDLDAALKEPSEMAQQDILRWMLQASMALVEAHHAGIIHRDIKPSNLFLNSDGILKVLDFGISKELAKPSEYTQPKMLIGTPHFMAPEQITSSITTDKADVWALGTVMFQLLARSHPYSDDKNAAPMGLLARIASEPVPSLGKVKKNLPEGITDLVRDAMKKNPNERISAAQFRDRILEIQNPVVPKKKNLFPVFAGVGAVALGSLVALGVLRSDSSVPAVSLAPSVPVEVKTVPVVEPPVAKVPEPPVQVIEMLKPEDELQALPVDEVGIKKTGDSPGKIKNNPPKTGLNFPTEKPVEPVEIKTVPIAVKEPVPVEKIKEPVKEVPKKEPVKADEKPDVPEIL